ncbi:237_t:CDS:2, partial [Gigaspora margarita]
QELNQKLQRLYSAKFAEKAQGLCPKTGKETFWMNELISAQKEKTFNYSAYPTTSSASLRLCFGPEAIAFNLSLAHPEPEYKNLYLLRGKGIHRVSFFDFLNQLKKELRIPARTELAPHTLRRCFATYNTLAGMPLNILQRILGHSKISTTALYIKDSDLIRAFQNSEEEKKQGKLIQLLLDEKLALELNHMLAESHLLARSLGITSSHCGEINPGASQGCRLARSQYFRNEKLLLDIAVIPDEELAQELLKERIFLDIRLAQIKLSYNTMTRKKYTELEKQILAQAKNQEKGSID